MLLLKLETPDDEKVASVSEFLQLERFHWIRQYGNFSFPYSECYHEFKQKVKLPAAYLDKMLGHRYTRHFYSEAERDAIRSKWLDPDEK